MAYVLTLKLKTEIYQEHKINKSFNVAVRIYNSLLSYEIKKLNLLEQDSLSDPIIPNPTPPIIEVADKTNISFKL